MSPTLRIATAALMALLPTAEVRTQEVLKHHRILLSQLPPPYATPSAGNPPRVIAQPPGATLHLPPGFQIAVYADGIENPRNMLLAPNGDVIVAETLAGRIEILRDADRDGVAESRFLYASGLDFPFGLALHDDWLYVGNEGSLVRLCYSAGATKSDAPPQRLSALPTGGHGRHFTRDLLFSRDGRTLYVSIGSSSNIDAGDPPERAAIVTFNPDGSNERVFASGLRNPVSMAREPVTGALWTTVNERDGLGDDLVPDYLTDVRPGAFYGWPYFYLGNHPDPRRSERPDLGAATVVPSLLIQAHSAPLGVIFYTGKMFPPQYRGGAFVALHGSVNRAPRTGYSVVFVPFRKGKPIGGYDDFVVGWLPDPASQTVWGRPVGLLQLRDGSLLISDDGAGKIWRVTYQSPSVARSSFQRFSSTP